jgi:hypothetical protein
MRVTLVKEEVTRPYKDASQVELAVGIRITSTHMNPSDPGVQVCPSIQRITVPQAIIVFVPDLNIEVAILRTHGVIRA